MDLIKFLDDYFSDMNQSFTLGVDLKRAFMFNKYFNEIKAKFEKYIKDQSNNLDFSNNSTSNVNSESLKDTVILPFLSGIINYINFLQEPQYEDYIKEYFLKFLEKFEESLFFQPFFDECCYTNFNSIFEEALKKNPSKLAKLINKHNIFFKDEFPVNKKIEHLNIVSSVQEYYKNLWDKLTINEAFDPNNMNFLLKLKNEDKKEQRKYFDDWVLKLAQIIENYFKLCLFTCYRVNALSRGEISERYDNLSRYSIKFASVLWNIHPKYYTFDNINRIRTLRNAIDHGNVEYQMDGEWDRYQFQFIDRKEKAKRSLEEFILDYFKLIKFVFTFDLVCKLFDLRILHPNKSLIEIIVEGFEESFPQFLEELRKVPKLNFEDIKDTVNKKRNKGRE